MKLGINRNQIEAELLKRDLKKFVKSFWSEIVPNDLEWVPHMSVVCDEIQAIGELVFTRTPKKHDLALNVPPGTGKTLLASVFATCWEFANEPSLRIAVGSYSDKAVLGISDNIKLVMESEKYQRLFPEVQIRKGMNTKHNFKTSANGEFYAFTIGGTITSKHFDILKVDDPIDPKLANSAAGLATARFFFEKVLPTRKVDKLVTPLFLIMQRLHMEDPTGLMLDNDEEPVRHVCLPAEISDDVKPAKYKSIYVEGLLDIKRLGKLALKRLKKKLGSIGYAGQMMQTPTPAEGANWKGSWFNVVPDHLFPESRLLTNYGTDWDLAYTKSQTNSASAYVTGGNYGTDIYIDDIGWDWLEFTELIAYMRKKPQPHYIEAKASGKSAKQTLTKLGLNAIEIAVTTDKVSRANFASPMAEAGRVYVRQSIIDKLLNNSKQGILGFPNNQGDLADTFAQALIRLNKPSVGVSVAIGNEDDLEYNDELSIYDQLN